MQAGGVVVERGAGVDHRVEHVVVDVDQLGGVLCDVAVVGHHHRYRLAHIAGPVDGGGVVGHRGLDRQGERPERGADLVGSDHGDDAGMGSGPVQAHGSDAGVGVGAAHDRGRQGAGEGIEVVEEAALATHQRSVLHARRLVSWTSHRDSPGEPPVTVISARAVKLPSRRDRRRILPTADFGMWSTMTIRLGRLREGSSASLAA